MAGAQERTASSSLSADRSPEVTSQIYGARLPGGIFRFGSEAGFSVSASKEKGTSLGGGIAREGTEMRAKRAFLATGVAWAVLGGVIPAAGSGLAAVPEAASPTRLPDSQTASSWVRSLQPISLAEGTAQALAAGRLAEALQTAARLDGPVAPQAAGPPLPGLAHLSAEARSAVESLAAAVSAAATRDPREAMALIGLAIESALPVLRAQAATLENGPAAIDAHPLTHAAEAIVEARRAGRPFEADPSALRAYEARLQEGGLTPDQVSSEFHAGVTDRMQHAVKHALEHEILPFLHQVEELRSGGAGGHSEGPPALLGPIPTSHLAGCVEPIPGTLRVCDEDPQIVTTPVTLHIDLGGSDLYTYGAGAASGPGTVQVVLDLEGSDTYLASGAGQGAGIAGGVGALIDVSGSDVYLVAGSSPALGQGYGSGGGAGVLADLEGSDFYGLTDVHSDLVDPTPETASASSPSVEVRGQGAADGGGVGVLLDSTGSNGFFALAVSVAEVGFGPGTTRPDGTVVLHTATAGSALAEVQGAASGPSSVAVHAAAGAPLPPGFPLGGSNFYFALSASLATANEWSNINFGGSRTCVADSGDALTRAQGAAAGSALAAHAGTGGFMVRFAEAFSAAFGECFEVSSMVSNDPMVSISHSGDATAEGQGSGTGGGEGGLFGAGGFLLDLLFADSVSTACSNCFQSGGTCTADSLTGQANVRGQGSGGDGGVGALLSLSDTAAQIAGAFESGSAWTLAVFGGVGIPTVAFSDSPGYFGPPLPSARVQGHASTGGIGALADLLGSDSYFAGAERFVTLMDAVSATFLAIVGLDLDKAELEGPSGIALLADVGFGVDSYLEPGNPPSGAANDSTWGAGLTTLSPVALELGIDRGI